MAAMLGQASAAPKQWDQPVLPCWSGQGAAPQGSGGDQNQAKAACPTQVNVSEFGHCVPAITYSPFFTSLDTADFCFLVSLPLCHG